jgi:hypothetical protein
MLRPFRSFLDVSRSFADECGTIEGSDSRPTLVVVSHARARWPPRTVCLREGAG